MSLASAQRTMRAFAGTRLAEPAMSAWLERCVRRHAGVDSGYRAPTGPLGQQTIKPSGPQQTGSLYERSDGHQAKRLWHPKASDQSSRQKSGSSKERKCHYNHHRAIPRFAT